MFHNIRERLRLRDSLRIRARARIRGLACDL